MYRTHARLVGIAGALAGLALLATGCNQATAPVSGPDFSVVVLPSSVTTIVGHAVTLEVTIAPENGFSGNVSLSMRDKAGQVPSNLSLSPTSTSVPAGQSVTVPVTIAAAAGATPATEDLSLVASHGRQAYSSPLTLVLRYSGTFGAATVYTVNTTSGGSLFSATVAVADANGDGHPDIITAGSVCKSSSSCTTANSVGDVWVLLNNGDGTFPTNPNQIPAYLAGSGSDPTSVAVADLNGKHRPDIITDGVIPGATMSGAVGVLMNNGNGTFGNAATYATGTNAGTYSLSAVAADVNGDGWPDIIAGDYSNPGMVSVLLNDGSGGFGGPKSYATGLTVADSVAVADVSGDGRPDIVTSSYADEASQLGSPGAVSVLLNEGSGAFGSPKTYAIANDPGAPQLAVAVADVNGDGKPDILVAGSVRDSTTNTDVGAVWVLLNEGGGAFASPVRYLTGNAALQSGLAVADVNGDGSPDIVVASNLDDGIGSGRVAVLLNRGNGTFGPGVDYKTGSSTTDGVAVADVNGDGKPDIVTANYGMGGTSVAYATSVSVLLGQ